MDMSVRRAGRDVAAGTGSDDAGEKEPRIDAEIIDAAPELQYGGSTFESASEYVRHRCRWTDPARVRVARALIDVDGWRALVGELRGLHTVSVALSDSAAGRFIRQHLVEQHWGVQSNRMATGILLLPSSFPDYLRGRARQAVRTNNRAAIAEGITCRRLDQDAIVATFEQWSRQRILPENLARAYRSGAPRALQDATWYVAEDALSSPLGLAKVWIDREWAHLSWMESVSRPARWLLHTHIVEDLCAAGVSNLSVHGGSALHTSRSIQYFQRRLGYRVAHLSLASTSRNRRLARPGLAEDNISTRMSSARVVARATLAAALSHW